MKINDDSETAVLLEEDEEEGEAEKGTYFRSCSGITAAFGIAILITSSGTSVQLLERRIPDFELNAFRFGVPLLFILIYLVLSRKYPVIERGKIGTTIFYGTVVFIASFCYFIAISLLPAALLSSLQSTSNIIASLVLFSVYWDEKITMSKTLFAVLCIIGVAMVSRPKFIKSEDVNDELKAPKEQGTNASLWNSTIDDIVQAMDINRHAQLQEINTYFQKQADATTSPMVEKTIAQTAREGTSNWGTTSETTSDQKITALSILEEKLKPGSFLGKIVGYIFAIMVGVAQSTSVLIVKKNPYINENLVAVIFWTFAVYTLFSIILTFMLEAPVLPSNWFDAAMVTIHSLTSAGIWPLFFYAPKCISGNTIALIWTSEVVFLLISQYTVLSSILPGHRNWMEVVGVVLVLLGCSMSSILEMVKSKATL